MKRSVMKVLHWSCQYTIGYCSQATVRLISAKVPIDSDQLTLEYVESLTIWQTKCNLPKAIYYFVGGHLRMGGRDLTHPIAKNSYASGTHFGYIPYAGFG
jgi:hypothetical protein